MIRLYWKSGSGTGSRNFLKEFYHSVLAMVKAPHRGFSRSPKIRRLADLRLSLLEAALAEVCALRVSLF